MCLFEHKTKQVDPDLDQGLLSQEETGKQSKILEKSKEILERLRYK